MDKSILIVDDEELGRRILERFLTRLGYTKISQAEDGIRALEIIVQNPPDLVILDIVMPRLDGLLLCEIMHSIEQWQHIPVIFQSALQGEENIKQGLAAGAHAYLEKPYTMENLKDTLDDAFRPSDYVPEELRMEDKVIIESIIDATKHLFNLVFGGQMRILEFTLFDEELLDRRFELVGNISADGFARIEVTIGCQQALALLFYEQFTGSKAETDYAAMDALQETLNLILGPAVALISKIYPVNRDVPLTMRNTLIPVNTDAQYKYTVWCRVSGYDFPLVITVQEKDFR